MAKNKFAQYSAVDVISLRLLSHTICYLKRLLSAPPQRVQNEENVNQRNPKRRVACRPSRWAKAV